MKASHSSGMRNCGMTKSLRPFKYSTCTLVPPGKAVDPAGVEPALPARQAGVVPLDHRPMSVRGVGVEPTLSRSQGERISFLPPERVDRREIAPRFPPCDSGVFLLDEQPSRGP